VSGGTDAWRNLALVGLGIIVTIVGVEAALHRLVPYPPPLREVEDAVREYRSADPTTLVLGSSHARAFDSLAAIVDRSSLGSERIVTVPVEFGKMDSYLWVFDNRLSPLLDERTPSGTPRRASLRRVVLVTEWWDSCDPPGGGPGYNLPARAWTLTDFLRDAAQHGLTSFNRNYLSNRFDRALRSSMLVRDRGHGLVLDWTRARVRPSPARDSAILAERTATWQRMIEDGTACLFAPRQVSALTALLDELQKRRLDVVIVLVPRKPGTLTPRGKQTTLASFAARMQEIGQHRDIEVIDLTTSSPLTDGDFAIDFDHLTPEGSAIFGRWGLAGPLAELNRPADRGGS